MESILLFVLQILQIAVPVLFAITLHEVSHGWVALKCGDDTAQRQGRLTINPIKHIDPIGTVLVPALLFYLGGFIFGWAKPVPITWQNLRNPQRDVALVGVAGPFSNLLMTLGWATLAKFIFLLDPSLSNTVSNYFVGMAKVGILINLVLMVLNMIPIPPLDGSRVVTAFISLKWAKLISEFEIYGFLILVILLASGALTWLIFPIISYLFNAIIYLFGL